MNLDNIVKLRNIVDGAIRTGEMQQDHGMFPSFNEKLVMVYDAVILAINLHYGQRKVEEAHIVLLDALELICSLSDYALVKRAEVSDQSGPTILYYNLVIAQALLIQNAMEGIIKE